MPRDVGSFEGEEKKAEQNPVTLVYTDVGGTYGPAAMTDFDAPLYLNRTPDPITGRYATNVIPVTGYTRFEPTAGLEVPAIEQSDDAALSELTISVSNVDLWWSGANIEGAYRDKRLDVWFGAIRQWGGAPEQFQFMGAVLMYTGRIDSMTVTETIASIRVVPHVAAFSSLMPSVPYSSDPSSLWGGFKHLPKPGTTLFWGYTEQEI